WLTLRQSNRPAQGVGYLPKLGLIADVCGIVLFLSFLCFCHIPGQCSARLSSRRQRLQPFMLIDRLHPDVGRRLSNSLARRVFPHSLCPCRWAFCLATQRYTAFLGNFALL